MISTATCPTFGPSQGGPRTARQRAGHGKQLVVLVHGLDSWSGALTIAGFVKSLGSTIIQLYYIYRLYIQLYIIYVLYIYTLYIYSYIYIYTIYIYYIYIYIIYTIIYGGFHKWGYPQMMYTIGIYELGYNWDIIIGIIVYTLTLGCIIGILSLGYISIYIYIHMYRVIPK